MKTFKIKPKTVLRTLLLVLIALVIGVNLYAINASRIAGNAVPMPFGVGAAVVLSGSMEPALSTGDLLIISETNDYAVGDVIVFQEGRIAVTHRIINMTQDHIITQGDANNTPDTPITREQIKGEVILAIPLVGYLVNAIKSPVGTLLIILLAVWLVEHPYRLEKENDRKRLAEIKAEIEKLKQREFDDNLEG